MWPLEQTAPVGEGNVLVTPEASPLVSLGRNAPNGGGFRSVRPPPEGASAANAAPLACPLLPPPPVFHSRFTIRRRDEARQIRPLPQERYPPPTAPPPRAVAFPSRPLPRVTSSPPASQTGPINHPSLLGSNPPQQPAATMEQNPQLPFVPSSAPMIREQEALRVGNALRTGMPLRSDDLRQPRPLPSPQRQPDHQVVQGGQLHPWNLPGREVVPSVPDDSPVEPQWRTGEFLWIRVGGKNFRLPMHILSESSFWSALAVFEPPPQGWSIPDVNHEIFTILIGCVYTEFGFHGTKSELNLVKLCYAFSLAKKWGMAQDRRKLRDTTYRYIVRRILGHDPNVPEDSRNLDHSHYLYRSEELYRTWELSAKDRSTQKMLANHDMIALYCCVIPQDLWPELTARFKNEFILLLHVSAAARRNSAGVASGVDYRRWWLHYYRLAGYQDASWLSPDAQHRLFAPLNPDEDKSPQERAEFAAARARGSALVNAFEAQQAQEQQPVTPVTPVTTATPVTPVITVTPVTTATPVTAVTSVIPDTSSREEFEDAPEYLPSATHHQETRRVRFAESPQVIIYTPQIELSETRHVRFAESPQIIIYTPQIELSETRRVQFAETPQVIGNPPQIDGVQMPSHNAVPDPPEEETFHGEAARAA
ncbi:hypothetical protein TGAM01_v205246 [Trichoderma gamsii]|uniref:BTB domain-containing protein n=1 Tax=Trichoderma gamsii TaxID=398673 RepID=A0A2P4ZND6_9HYPO|nr:hypothetical protein TGAM01_v205246 [Trichoderma gamsii]PON25809.1 hypothetical protein TGAM01_v205246 [Trichoderma gamsii]